MKMVESESNSGQTEETSGSIESEIAESGKQLIVGFRPAVVRRGEVCRIGAILAVCCICALLIGFVTVPAVRGAAYSDQSPQSLQLAEDIQTIDLIAHVSYSAWTQADGGVRITVTDQSDGSVVQEKEIPFNADSVIDSLLPGDYNVKIQLPITADGIVLSQPQETELAVPDDANGDGVVRIDTPVFAMADAEVTDDYAAAAAAAYARDDAEKASIFGRYQAKKAAEATATQATADQAAVQQTADQTADGGSSGSSYSGASSYDDSCSGDSDSASSSDPSYSATSVKHQPQTVKTVTTYYCNTCKAAFNSLDALLAHQEETYEAWERDRSLTIHGGYTSDTETWSIE